MDMGSQHVVRQSLYMLQMKDAADASNYVGKHAVLRERLLRMGVVYTDAEAVFQLLRGLPHSGSWPQFKALMTITLPTITPTTPPAGTAVTAAVPTLSAFDICVACISAEAAHILNEHILSTGGPGSEYANAATASSAPSSGNINPITGLRKHRHNPEGVFCMTVGCNKGDHDHAHCYTKGGGMEGQAPWMKGKKKEKETTAAAITAPPAPTPPSTVITAFAGADTVDTFFMDLSCASLVEVPDLPPAESAVLSCLVTAGFNTILDSGTTMTLIHDRSYFWSYSTAEAVTV
jgi:hypothetical protein